MKDFISPEFRVYQVVMDMDGRYVPCDIAKDLDLLKACFYADVFQRRNPARRFIVINQINGDIEYEA